MSTQTTDPRGPHRKVLSVERTPSANLTALDCGHTAHLNPTMAPSKTGDLVRCFDCGPAGAREAARRETIAEVAEAIRDEARALERARAEAERQGGIGRPSSPVSPAGARAIAEYVERLRDRAAIVVTVSDEEAEPVVADGELPDSLAAKIELARDDAHARAKPRPHEFDDTVPAPAWSEAERRAADPLDDLRGPDGDLGTNADDAERILDAREAEAEGASVDDE